jgi:hypothetical protein
VSAKEVIEGVVHPPSDWEPGEQAYLELDGGRGVPLVWPRYLLNDYIGKRVRITIEVLP